MTDRDTILANHVQPERTCTRCNQPTTRYQVTSIDNRCVECSECLAKRERQDEIEKQRMMNPDGNKAHQPRKAHVSYEWQPFYD